MGDLDRTVSFGVEIDASQTDQASARYTSNVQKMTAANAAFGAQSSASLTPATAAINRLTQSLLQVGVRFQETGQISSRSLVGIGVQLENLQSQYGKVAAAAQGLTVAERQAFGAAQAAYKQAIDRAREYNEVQQRIARQTRDWTSLQGALEGLSGPLGNIAKVGFGVVAAFGAGYQAGRKLDEWLQANIAGWADWEKKVTNAIVGVKKGLDDVSKDPRFAGTRTAALMPQIQERQFNQEVLTGAQAGLAARGVQTFTAAKAQVDDFRKSLDYLKIEDTAAVALGKVGTGTEAFFQAQKANILGWATAYKQAGHEIPSDLQGIIEKLGQVDAAVIKSKSAVEAISASQELKNQARDLEQYINGLNLKFRPPAVDSVMSALQGIKDLTASTFQDLENRANKASQAFVLDTARVAELGAEIAKLKDTGAVGPEYQAQLAALEQQRAAVAARAQEEQKEVGILLEQKKVVSSLAEGLDQDALASMYRAADLELRKLSEDNKNFSRDFQESLIGLPATAVDKGLQELQKVLAQLRGVQGNPVSMFGPLSPEELDLSVKLFSDQVKRSGLDFRDNLKDGAQALEDSAAKSAEAFGASLRAVTSDLTELLASGLEGGAQGFGKTAADIFSRQLRTNVQDILQRLGSGLFGGVTPGQINPATGQPYTAGEADAQNQKAQQATQGAINLIALFSQLGAAGAGASNVRQQPVGTVVGAGVAGLSAGVSIAGVVGASSAVGGIIGAIVGLIIGGLMLALAPAVGKSYPYAKFGVGEGGSAFFDPTQNITPNEQADALARIRKTYDQFWKGYVQVLLDLPLALPDVFKDLSSAIYPTIGKDKPGGDIGGAPSKNFWQDFANYLSQGMPRDIAARFFEPLSTGFQKLGLTADAFLGVWTRLQELDPAEAMQIFDALAVGLSSLKKAIDYYQSGSRGMLTTGFADANKTFSQNLAEQNKEIIRFGESIAALPLEEQAKAMAQFGDQVAASADQVREFIKGIALAIQSVNQSYTSAIRELQLQGITNAKGEPDVQGQVDFLKKYADELLGQIRAASTPEEVLRLSQELQNTIMRIQQLGGSVSPEAAKAFREWAINNLGVAQKAVTDKLQEFAKEVADQQKAFTDAIQGFIDAFNAAAAALATGQSPPPATGDHSTDHGANDEHGNPPFITDPNTGRVSPNPAYTGPDTRPDTSQNPYAPRGPRGGGMPAPSEEWMPPYRRGHTMGGEGGGGIPTDWLTGIYGYGEPTGGLWRPGAWKWPWQREAPPTPPPQTPTVHRTREEVPAPSGGEPTSPTGQRTQAEVDVLEASIRAMDALVARMPSGTPPAAPGGPDRETAGASKPAQAQEAEIGRLRSAFEAAIATTAAPALPERASVPVRPPEIAQAPTEVAGAYRPDRAQELQLELARLRTFDDILARATAPARLPTQASVPDRTPEIAHAPAPATPRQVEAPSRAQELELARLQTIEAIARTAAPVRLPAQATAPPRPPVTVQAPTDGRDRERQLQVLEAQRRALEELVRRQGETPSRAPIAADQGTTDVGPTPAPDRQGRTDVGRLPTPAPDRGRIPVPAPDARRPDAIAPIRAAMTEATRDQVRLLSDMVQHQAELLEKMKEQNDILREGRDVNVSGILEVVDETGAVVEEVPLEPDSAFAGRTQNSRRRT